MKNSTSLGVIVVRTRIQIWIRCVTLAASAVGILGLILAVHSTEQKSESTATLVAKPEPAHPRLSL
jgi:hypothetical protein